MTGETFKEYVDSYSYGSRADLLFKFMKNLPGDGAGDFFQSLLVKLGETIDDGDPARLYDLVYEAQQAAYSPPDRAPRWAYDDAPYSALQKPLSETRVGLLTSSGHYETGKQLNPLGDGDITQAEAMKQIGDLGRAAAQLSPVPVDLPPERLRVMHPGYDIRAAQEDIDTVIPVNRLKELANDGVIGELASPAYSFIGLTSQLRLTKEVLPGWVSRVKEEGWEAAVLVPV